MGTLDGQRAIVSGAAGSLGFATASRLVGAGASVVLADLRGQDQATAKLAQAGHNCLAHEVDATDEASVARLADAAVARFGRIDVLVNLGYLGTRLSKRLRAA